MANIGSAALMLTTDNSKLEAGLKKAGGTITAWTTKIGNGVSFTATGAMGALAAGLKSGFDLFKGSFMSSLDQIDKISKASRKIGIGSEGLGGLAHAAELSDVSFEQLGVGLKNLNKNLSLAATGSETAQAMFERLGLDSAALKAMPMEKALGMIADKIKNLKDPADRARIAMEIFGKSGVDMLPMLLDGSKNLEQMADEAKKFGKSFNDAAGLEIEKFNDNLTRAKGIFAGVTNQIATALIPVLNSLGEEFDLTGLSLENLQDFTLAAIEGMMIGWNRLMNVLKMVAGYFLKFVALQLDGIARVSDALDDQAGRIEIGWAKITGGDEAVKALFESKEWADRQANKNKNGDWFREARDKANAAGDLGINTGIDDGAGRITARFEKIRRELAKKINPKGEGTDMLIEPVAEKVVKEEKSKFQSAAAIVRGSKEAFSSSVAFRFGGLGSGEDKNLAEQKKQTALQQQQLKTQKEIAAKEAGTI